MIQAHELTKRYGDKTAVHTLSFTVAPGTLSFISLDWVETTVSHLPLPASSALLATGAAETHGACLSTQASLIVMVAYAVVPIAAAAVPVRPRPGLWRMEPIPCSAVPLPWSHRQRMRDSPCR